jgi:hypothetical protein
MARLTLLLAFLAGALCAYASPPLHSAPVSMPRRLLLTRTLAVVRTTTTGCVLSFNIANNVHAILKHSQLATHSSTGGEWQGTRDTADWRRAPVHPAWSSLSLAPLNALTHLLTRAQALRCHRTQGQPQGHRCAGAGAGGDPDDRTCAPSVQGTHSSLSRACTLLHHAACLRPQRLLLASQLAAKQAAAV